MAMAVLASPNHRVLKHWGGARGTLDPHRQLVSLTGGCDQIPGSWPLKEVALSVPLQPPQFPIICPVLRGTPTCPTVASESMPPSPGLSPKAEVNKVVHAY